MKKRFRSRQRNSLQGYLLTAVFGLIVLGILVKPALGQIDNDKKFSPVPVEWRARLVERLNLFIEYERTKQYDKLFDLLPEEYILAYSLNKNEVLNGSQRQFFEGGSYPAPIDLEVVKVERSPNRESANIFIIQVREKQHVNGRIVDDSNYYIAYLHAANWYLYHTHVER